MERDVLKMIYFLTHLYEVDVLKLCVTLTQIEVDVLDPFLFLTHGLTLVDSSTHM